ncbi:MAG: hypothetical protein QOF84_818, partial [Streptomyces sp.]|nr:hypothetical protein [Streptomyces sp.]
IGTDLASGWMLWLTAGCVAAVAVALVLRTVLAPRRDRPADIHRSSHGSRHDTFGEPPRDSSREPSLPIGV